MLQAQEIVSELTMSLKLMIYNGCRTILLTAGKAKKDIPNRAQHEAMILPGQVMGTVSP